jgi:hypothetical protein
MSFQARHIDCRGTVPVALPPDEALELFTPVGETWWVPGWKPTYLHPADGQLQRDLAWTTGDPGAETLWLTVEADRENRRVAYARITPGFRLGRVDVHVQPALGGSVAVVRYAMTALNEEGNQQLEEFEAGFEAMMGEWASLVETYLAKGPTEG